LWRRVIDPWIALAAIAMSTNRMRMGNDDHPIGTPQALEIGATLY
jgi:hypothetical protein